MRLPANKAQRIALCAYVAGLVDGDGYVGIRRRLPSKANRMSSARYSAAVGLEMTDEAPVRLVADLCECNVLRRVRGTNKPIYGISIERDKACALLRELLPYLVAKKRHAELALKLSDFHKKRGPGARTKVVGRHRFKTGVNEGCEYRVFGYSDDHQSALDAIYLQSLHGAARSGNGARFAR